jgi:hypothetical protein
VLFAVWGLLAQRWVAWARPRSKKRIRAPEGVKSGDKEERKKRFSFTRVSWARGRANSERQ